MEDRSNALNTLGRLTVRLYVCPSCGWRSRTDVGLCQTPEEVCGETIEAKDGPAPLQTCERCQRGPWFDDEGTYVVTDPGDRTSPGDGYWICQDCADTLQAEYEAAEEAAIERRRAWAEDEDAYIRDDK